MLSVITRNLENLKSILGLYLFLAEDVRSSVGSLRSLSDHRRTGWGVSGGHVGAPRVASNCHLVPAEAGTSMPSLNAAVFWDHPLRMNGIANEGPPFLHPTFYLHRFSVCACATAFRSDHRNSHQPF